MLNSMWFKGILDIKGPSIFYVHNAQKVICNNRHTYSQELRRDFKTVIKYLEEAQMDNVLEFEFEV